MAMFLKCKSINREDHFVKLQHGTRHRLTSYAVLSPWLVVMLQHHSKYSKATTLLKHHGMLVALTQQQALGLTSYYQYFDLLSHGAGRATLWVCKEGGPFIAQFYACLLISQSHCVQQGLLAGRYVKDCSPC